MENGHLNGAISDEDEETWEEVEKEDCSVPCIFTKKTFLTADSYFLHLKANANFDIWNLVRVEFGLDFFGYVKLINFLRKQYQGCDPPTIQELHTHKIEWMDDKYLKPVLIDDPLLQYILDDDSDDECAANCMVEKDEETFDFVKEKLHSTLEKNEELCCQVNSLLEKVNDMKSFMKDVILTGDIYRPVSACRKTCTIEEENFEDSSYFGSYAHHGIHGEMLQDKTRTLSYKNAFLSNPEVFKNKIVLDVGCGTGILSMFAAAAGAKHVYAVDMSDIAYQAMEIIQENNLNNKITVIKDCIEEVKLPVDKVDIIISEWMGYFLLYESMLDSVLYASEKWLSCEGYILPDKCNLFLVACHDEAVYQSQVAFWDDVYGLKMSCMKRSVISEAFVSTLASNSAVSNPVSIFSFDVKTVKQSDLDFKSDFSLSINKSGKCSCIVGYFDIFFEQNLKNIVSFSTAPWSEMTHWKQTVFFLNSPLDVNSGDEIAGHISCRKNPADPRTLLIELTLDGQVYVYKMS